MKTHVAELLEWYSGEIGGEAFFCELARHAGAPEHAAKWQTLARLERFVAARLRSALSAQDVALPPADDDVRRGVDSARPYATLSWREALARLRPELDGYVREFQGAVSRMPRDLRPLARFVTSHEEALLEFVIRELEQDGRQSLDRVHRLLGAAAD